ncbi:uncharacterized protein LOC133333577 [Musca vetustissima]|uniref:uncharacterized protein LOC133333577 n=1 Tax=Musca vetustissima TaxID=27455 RepID=UPI002AB74211|nr:uncharacterized protein LOC133333577 [Musca vetustissima]
MKWEILKFLITFGAVLLFCNQNCLAWRSYKIIFTTFEYEVNPKHLKANIQIQNTTGETTLNIMLNVLSDIDDIVLNYDVAIEGDQPNNFTTIVKRKIEFCKFLQERPDGMGFRRHYEDILKQDSFIRNCPLKKNSVFTLRNYNIDEELLPQYVPETHFYVDLQMDMRRRAAAPGDVEMLLKGRINGSIDKSKGFNNLKMFSMG